MPRLLGNYFAFQDYLSNAYAEFRGDIFSLDLSYTLTQNIFKALKKKIH